MHSADQRLHTLLTLLLYKKVTLRNKAKGLEYCIERTKTLKFKVSRLGKILSFVLRLDLNVKSAILVVIETQQNPTVKYTFLNFAICFLSSQVKN